MTNRASLRRLLRGARTVRGALLLLFIIVVLVGWLGCAVGVTMFMKGGPEALRYAGTAEPYLPLFLLALFLQSVLGSRGAVRLHFSPAEVDFLFAGPFHRRELLLSKLYRQGAGLVVSALLLSMTPVALFFRGWFSAFVGLALSGVFLNLAGLAATLTRLIVAEAAHTRVRKAVLIAVATLAAVALPQTIARANILRPTDLAASFGTSWPGRVLLAPFQVFSNAILAERLFPDLVGWAAAAAAIDLALLILVLKLDADYLEWSAEISASVYEQMQRIRRGGGFAITLSRRPSRFGIPRLPWIAGAGPIAWRQLVQTSRALRPMVRLALIFAIFMLIWNWVLTGRSPGAMAPTGLAIGLVCYVTFLLGMAFPMSFRGDLDHLDFLKTLPVRPMALAAGELAGCAAVLTALQLLILGICAAAAATVDRLLLSSAILAFPVDLLLLAASNLVFLIYPVRRTPGTSSDLNTIGRGVLSFFLLLLILLPLLVIAAGLGAAAYLASGSSLPAMIAAASAALLVEVVPLIMLVARAFERFDPSTETPA